MLAVCGGFYSISFMNGDFMALNNNIASLNDAFRKSGTIMYSTLGIKNLAVESFMQIIGKVRNYTGFTTANAPYGEHDFGDFEHDGKKIFFKIDCYDKDMERDSPNPESTELTQRVLTVMLAEEY